ncbi:QhpX: predicted quinohemoprotein amine dehydrogenase, putative activating subunit [Desulfosarcina variabilis str. Montpellier]|uniref:SPASM domain-containing protein n=1 Tax=Desulfosarcina variabilis TaxID=2300 RepID=UPI003AFB3447
METFTLSDYKRFDIDGRPHLFLPSQNAIFEADDDIMRMLDRTADHSAGDPFSKPAFVEWVGGTSQDITQVFEQLGRIGLLRPVRDPSWGEPKSVQHPGMPVKTLVLHVTDACNLNCSYCYYHGGTRPDNGKVMTMVIARQAVDFLMEASGALDRVELVFFGGEPLLNQKLIAEAVAYANGSAAERGKSVDFALTTNATLLNESTTAFLLENRIGVTISIDGLPEVHDRYRRFPDGSPSFAIIEPGIRRLIDATHGKPVVARVTVAGNPGDLTASLDYLLDMGFAEAGFAPVTSTDPRYRLSPDAMEALLGQFEALSQQFLDRARENRFLGFTNLIDLLVTLHEGEVRAYPCGAGLGLFSVSTEGGLFLCQRLTGESDAAMGNIYRGLDETALADFRQSVHVSAKPACRECWARSICAGGCYHEALVREGGLTAANLHYCDWIKRWIEIGIDVYGRLADENPDYLDTLSALRGHENHAMPKI